MTSGPAGRRADDAEIWIICGNTCAGKTTTGHLLARRLPLAAHIEGDEMQRLIVSGTRWAVPGDNDPRTGRLTGEADGRVVNQFEEVIEAALDRLPDVGLRVDPTGLEPESVVDLLLDRRAEAPRTVEASSARGR